MISNDAVIFGFLISILGFVFYTSSINSTFWKKFYTFCPTLLICYFLPSLLEYFDIIDSSNSNLYYVASRFLLPCSLVLLTISVDLKEIIKLGPKALIMFFTGTLGVLLCGPISLIILKLISHDLLNLILK